MIIDTSAVIAILGDEPDRPDFERAIAHAARPRMSAAAFVEVAIVVDSRGNPLLSRVFDDFIADAEIVVESVTASQAKIAREAYRDFGRGSGHPARLNFGDCFSYALAKDADDDLLFKGNDFTHTDVRSALT